MADMRKTEMVLRGLLITIILMSTVSLPAQETASSAQHSIPTIVKFVGSFPEFRGQLGGSLIGVTFALYKDEAGGAPLWMETQNVQLDASGRFTVFLGSASEKGLPVDAFVSGDARWLGITRADGEEGSRIMLVSVPYAVTAASAQTINGRPPEEFVTQEQLSSRLAVPIAPRPSETQNGNFLYSPLEAPLTSSNESNGSTAQRPGKSTATPRHSGKAAKANASRNVRALQTSDNWSLGGIPTDLAAGIQATVILSPCPVGVDTSGSPSLGGPNGGYPIYINDSVQPGSSESVYVTGGTCTSAANSGTIVFTPYFSHAQSTYTLGSSSAGIQEAINESCGINTTSWKNGGCQVVIPPIGPQSGAYGNYAGYDIYDTMYFHANESVLTGYGAVLNCHERGPCLQIGDLINSNDYVSNMIEGISFRSLDNHQSDPAFNASQIESTQRIGGQITIHTSKPHNLRSGDRVTQMLTDTSTYWGDVPAVTVLDATHYSYQRANTVDIPFQMTPGVVALSYEAVLDNGESTTLEDIVYEKTYEYGAFNHFFDLWDDENAQISNFNNNAISLNDNLNWTGSFVWSGGALNLPNKSQQLAPVITVNNSTLTANGSNCATVYNSNQFTFENSICQAQGPWEFLISNVNGNYQGSSFQNIYSEATASGNPSSPTRSPWPGLGVAGFIGGPTSGAGTYSLSGQGGFGGALPTVGSGSTTFVYYVVVRDVTAGTQTSPLPFMYEMEDSPTQVTVQWPRLAFGTHTIVYDLIRNPAPAETMNAAAGGYIAPYMGGCNGGSNSSCGSVALGVPQCSGFVCSVSDNTATATASYNVQPGTFAPNPSFWPGVAVLSSTPLISSQESLVTGIAFQGSPDEYADYCSSYGANVSGGYTVCHGSQTTANNSVPDQPAMILTDGNTAGGGGTPGAKGRLIVETTPASEAAWHQVITVYDSNPNKTQATTGHRPVGDPGDMFLGIDPNQNLMVGGGVNGIATYVNNIGDGKGWKEMLTNSLKTFQVPLQAPAINVLGGLSVNGSYGHLGDCLRSTGFGSIWEPCPSGGIGGPPRALFVGNSQARMDIEPSRTAERVNIAALSGKARLTFPEVHNGVCAAVIFHVSGVFAGDAVAPKWPSALEDGLQGTMVAKARDTIEVRLCNHSGKTLTPKTRSFGAVVFKSPD